MSEAAAPAGSARWADAALAAALCAIDPVGLGGVALRALPGPARERWLERLRELLPPATPLRRVPLHIGDERLLGGLDLAATLQAGRPVAQQGLLAEADGGLLLLAMAERIAPGMAARLAAVLDCGEVVVERDGLALRQPARLGVIALDEGRDDDEALPPTLLDRLAFHLDLDGLAVGALSGGETWDADDVQAARARLAQVAVDDEVVEALCAAALALGVASLRAPLLALRAARAAAALDGRLVVASADAALAARLVLAPRATRLPPAEDEPPPETASDEPEPPADAEADEPVTPGKAQPLDDVVLEAAQAAIPAGLLAAIVAGGTARAAGAGRAGALQASRLRGRPVGARRGEPRGGARLALLDTLRAAAPWQRLRRGEAGPGHAARLQVRRDDFRVRQFQQRSETTTLFVVDASGSAALHRLAEAKGAVELLLADCYVRRDRVAVLAFRGAGAELLLPPTRSLPRAKRSLAGLPGGGGTPLAAGLDAARTLAEAVLRRGGSPVVVLLTDGRANIARDGGPGRERATADALGAARALRGLRASLLLLDTSPQPAPQPAPQARALADAMGARYLPLPHAAARELSQAVRLASAPAR